MKLKIDTERKAWFAHRRLWDWLSKNPDKEKKDWPEWETYQDQEELEKFQCFACFFTGFNNSSRLDCDICPINWGETPSKLTFSSPCLVHDADYFAWSKAWESDKRAALAEKIRDAWPEPPRELEFVGIDDWNRPVFKEIGTRLYFGSLDILFHYQETEAKIKEKVSEKDLLYFGTDPDGDPMGTSPGVIRINWRV